MIKNLVLEYRMRKLEKVVSGNMPKYFYHGTRADMVQSILKNGLKPGKEVGYSVHSLTNTNKVYLTMTINSAKNWARMSNKDDFVVLQIDSSYLNPDLLEGDYNALRDPFSDDGYYDEDNDDEDNENEYQELDGADDYENLKFDSDEIPLDYEYAGNIPAKAISVIYQSNKDFLSEAEDHEENGDYKWFVSNWNKYIDADCGTREYQDLLCGAVRKAANIPLSYGKNKKLTSIILSLPPKILNYTYENGYGDKDSVLIDLACHGGFCDEIGQLMSDIADKFENTISDENLEFLWKFFTKPKQAKNIDIIANLPERFLKIGKPYLTKKLIKELGI